MEVLLYFLYCTAIIFLYLYFYFKKVFGYWAKKNVETITPRIPFGNIGKIITNKLSIGDGLREIHENITGPFAGIYCLTYPALVVKDPELIKNILVKDFNHFSDRGFYIDEEKEPISGQLFRLRGKKWKHMRRTVSPAFTLGKLKMVFPEMLKVGEKLNFHISDLTAEGTIIDTLDLCIRYNADIIASVIFGLETNSFKYPHNEYILLGKELFSEYSRWRMLKFILLVLAPQCLEIFRPKTIQARQEKFILDMVKNVVEYREANGVRRNDIMQILIDLKNEEGKVNVQNQGVTEEDNGERINLTIEDLAAQAYTYFFAGFESSSSTMNFLLYHCALDTNLQIKIQEDIDAAIENTGGALSYEAILKMQYLHQAILETLRYYPILPHLNRVAVQNYTIPRTNIIIEKGTRIFISINGIQHDAAQYPDPETFDPDRFSPKNSSKRNPFTYLPFGEGPRNCIGKKMGELMVALGMVMVLKDYTVDVCADTQIPLQFSPFTYNYKTTERIQLKLSQRF